MNMSSGNAQQAVFDDFLRNWFERRPVDATFVGHHDGDGSFPDWSTAGHQQSAATWAGLRALIGTHVRNSPMGVPLSTDPNDVDLDLADRVLAVQLAEHESRHFSRGNPSLAVGEFAFGLIGLVTRNFGPVEQRAESFLARLRAGPRFLAGALDGLRGASVPQRWLDRALREGEATINFLDAGVADWVAVHNLEHSLASSIVDASRFAAGGLSAFLETLRQTSPHELPVATCGGDLLDLLIREGHCMDQSHSALLLEAKDRFAAEQARLIEMAGGDLQGALDRLASRHPTRDKYLGAFHQTWEDCVALCKERDVVSWPNAPVRYVPIPTWTRMAAPFLYYLFYRSPAPYDQLEAFDYVVTPLDGLDDTACRNHLRVWNDSVIKLNHVVHHGAIGHHVQNVFARSSTSRMGRIAATDSASRLAFYCGGTMAEGWACYATDLMEELGFLTPDERIAEQQSRVRMLARAIVDIELHTGARTFDDAVALYHTGVGMPLAAAQNETVKNSMFPGTGLMYWFGTQDVHAARREAAERWGNNFTLRRFHDEFLRRGSLPTSLVRRLMAQDTAPGLTSETT